MPLIFKCTQIFQGPQHGWEETWWILEPTDDYQKVMDRLQELCGFRAKLLGKQAKIIGQRVSAEGIVADAIARATVYPGNEEFDCDEPDAALLFRVENGPRTKHKNCYLRGIPDVIDEQFGVYNPVPGGFGGLVNEWKTCLQQRGWGWYGTPNGGRIKIFLLQPGYESVGNNRIKFTLAAPLVIPGGAPPQFAVRFAGINKPAKSNLNSQVIVTQDDATHVTTILPYGVLPWVSGGWLNYNSKNFIGVAQGAALRIVTRRVGAPLLVSRGRGRVRAKG